MKNRVRFLESGSGCATAALAEEILFDCIRITEYDDVIYLLDFDVLRNYLEVGAHSSFDQVSVDSIFYSSSKRYALPWGAYLEFLDWFAEMQFVAQDIATNVVGNADRAGVIANIATVLNIVPDGTSEGEVIAGIRDALHGKALSLIRLMNIFTDPRFMGFIPDFDYREANVLTEIISRIPRSRGISRREKVDQRDAINVATVLRFAREAMDAKKRDPDSRVTGYFLISQTGLVLKLVEKIKESLLDGDEHGETDLEQLRVLLGSDQTPDNHSLPCMHPREVANIERLGVYGKPTAFRQIRGLRDSLRQFTDHLEEQIIQMRMVAGAKAEEKQIMLQQIGKERQETKKWIESLARDSYSSEYHPIFPLELNRSMSLSTDLAKREQLGLPITHADEVGEESIGFLRLLGDVYKALEFSAGVGYAIGTEPLMSQRKIHKVYVRQLPAPEHEKPIIEGEMYGFADESRSGWEHFEFRWPTTSGLRYFLSALGGIVGGSLENSDLEGDIVDFVSEDSPLWQEGAVLYTDLGVVGLPLARVLTDAMTLARLREHLQTKCTDRVRSALKVPRLEIQQVRVNTTLGDFAFDIFPTEGEVVRYLTVISTL